MRGQLHRRGKDPFRRPGRVGRAQAGAGAGLAGCGLTVLLALTLAACGGGSGSSQSGAADTGYLSELHNAVPDVASLRTDTQLVRLGHAACDGFAAGASYEQLADRLALLEGSHPLPSEDLGAVITSAADNYCPKFRGRVS